MSIMSATTNNSADTCSNNSSPCGGPEQLITPAPQSSRGVPCSGTPPSRYESQKRRDWTTFNQYLHNHRPPLNLSRCSGAHVLEFLRYLDQFGKTKVHAAACPYFGRPAPPPAPCACPLKQAWGSLDALVGRLRAAFEEHGGHPEANPFGARAVRLYLRHVRDEQGKARGIAYDKKKKKNKNKAGANNKVTSKGKNDAPTVQGTQLPQLLPLPIELSEDGYGSGSGGAAAPPTSLFLPAATASAAHPQLLGFSPPLPFPMLMQQLGVAGPAGFSFSPAAPPSGAAVPGGYYSNLENVQYQWLLSSNGDAMVVPVSSAEAQISSSSGGGLIPLSIIN